jgi:hypothetical protein
MNTAEVIEEVEAARVPGDLFGPTLSGTESVRAARRRFHRLTAHIHPDRVAPAERVRAAAAFTRASDLYRRWLASTVTTDPCPVLTGSAAQYVLGPLHARGSTSNLHHATRKDGTAVIVKIPRAVTSNTLLDNEQAALCDIAASADNGHEWLLAYFPCLIDHLVHLDPTDGARRVVNVLDDLTSGFVTLAEVHTAYPAGLDPRDWAWMHRRLLRAVAAAHRAGWIHTAITADNVLIHPQRHGVVLAGWSFATPPGRVPTATIPSQRHHYPPEAREHGTASTGWDVYMTHSLMLPMLGDQPPEPLRRFAHGCMHPDPRTRPDAVDLLTEFDDLLDRLYGRRRFRPFSTTPTKGQ